MKQKISISFYFLIVFAVTFAAFYFVSAWTEPSAVAPNSNVAAPVNVGSSYQAKVGSLLVNSGGAVTGFVVPAGKVGIGTTLPGPKLEVNIGATANDGVALIDSSYRSISLRSNLSTNSYNALTLSGDLALIYQGAAVNTGSLTIGQWSNQPRGIRIDANGNVGIGLQLPTQKLDVAGYVQGTGLCIGTDCRTTWPAPPSGTSVGFCTAWVQDSVSENMNCGSYTTYHGGNIEPAYCNTSTGACMCRSGYTRRPMGRAIYGTWSGYTFWTCYKQ